MKLRTAFLPMVLAATFGLSTATTARAAPPLGTFWTHKAQQCSWRPGTGGTETGRCVFYTTNVQFRNTGGIPQTRGVAAYVSIPAEDGTIKRVKMQVYVNGVRIGIGHTWYPRPQQKLTQALVPVRTPQVSNSARDTVMVTLIVDGTVPEGGSGANISVFEIGKRGTVTRP